MTIKINKELKRLESCTENDQENDHRIVKHAEVSNDKLHD